MRLLERPLGRLGRRSAAAGALRALPEALRRRRFSTASARPRSLHIFISNQPGRDPPGLERASSCRATRRGSSTTTASPSPTGEIGNLLVKGDSTCAAYWNKHDKTKDTIEGHWIRTGDKYYQDADGFFWYAGRGDDMLKVGGIWVSPVEVENALVEHPAVLECGVVGREDHDRAGQAAGVRRAARRA